MLRVFLRGNNEFIDRFPQAISVNKTQAPHVLPLHGPMPEVKWATATKPLADTNHEILVG